MYGHPRSSFAQAYIPPGGRSPYGNYTQYPTDRHFSELVEYVDEDRSLLSPTNRNAAVFEDDDEPDRVHLKFRGESWSSDFPPFSIAEERVVVRHLRERVATHLGLEGHEGRIKLVYKDRELKHNDSPLRKYGCKQNSEIAVILLSEPKDWNRRHQSDSDNASIGSGRRSVEEVRPMRRHNSTHRRRDPEPRPTANERYNGRLHPESAHNTPPMSNTPPRQPSPARPQRPERAERVERREPSPAPPRAQPPTADPKSMLGKIQTIRYEFYSEWYPKIDGFMRAPPSDADERTKEYRRLSEIVYKRVFEAGDLIEPEGADKEEIRTTRKKLFADAHEILKDLDRFKPKEGK